MYIPVATVPVLWLRLGVATASMCKGLHKRCIHSNRQAHTALLYYIHKVGNEKGKKMTREFKAYFVEEYVERKPGTLWIRADSFSEAHDAMENVLNTNPRDPRLMWQMSYRVGDVARRITGLEEDEYNPDVYSTPPQILETKPQAPAVASNTVIDPCAHYELTLVGGQYWKDKIDKIKALREAVHHKYLDLKDAKNTIDAVLDGEDVSLGSLPLTEAVNTYNRLGESGIAARIVAKS